MIAVADHLRKATPFERWTVDGFVASTPTEYAKYIQKLYDDVDFYHRMSLAARHRATDFELDRIVEKYNKVCLEAVSSKNLIITPPDDKIAIVIVYWSDDGIESASVDNILTYLNKHYTTDQYELFLINNGRGQL